MKPILDYNIFNGQTPEGESYIRPAIVNRDSPNDLEQILKNAIDRGLIAGLKETACASIAQGIVEQMYKELTDGHSVQFGDFFSVRLYLDGQTDGSGNLNELSNSVNPRFLKGDAFGLKAGDFTLHYVGGGDRPTLSKVCSENNTSQTGRLDTGDNVLIFGTNLLPAAGQTLKVVFQRENDGEIEETVIDTFETVNVGLIKFAYPVLPASATYKVFAVFEDDETGRLDPSTARNVYAEATPAPVASEITNVFMAGEQDPQDDVVDFCDNTTKVRAVIPDADAEDLQGATIKMQLMHEGAVWAELDEPDDVVTADGSIEGRFDRNTSSRPDGDWWGQPCKVVVTFANGLSSERDVMFKDHT